MRIRRAVSGCVAVVGETQGELAVRRAEVEGVGLEAQGRPVAAGGEQARARARARRRGSRGVDPGGGAVQERRSGRARRGRPAGARALRLSRAGSASGASRTRPPARASAAREVRGCPRGQVPRSSWTRPRRPRWRARRMGRVGSRALARDRAGDRSGPGSRALRLAPRPQGMLPSMASSKTSTSSASLAMR
jgi:hypothetical protein